MMDESLVQKARELLKELRPSILGGSIREDTAIPIITRALQSRPADALDGWQDIATAPKDGSYMLFAGTNFDGGMAVVHWDDGLDWWQLDDGKNPEIALRHESKLTHWRPLPPPPAALAQSAQVDG